MHSIICSQSREFSRTATRSPTLTVCKQPCRRSLCRLSKLADRPDAATQPAYCWSAGTPKSAAARRAPPNHPTARRARVAPRLSQLQPVRRPVAGAHKARRSTKVSASNTRWLYREAVARLHVVGQPAQRKRSNHDVLSMRINRLLNGVFLPRGTHSEPNIES